MCSIASIAKDYSRPASCTAQWAYQPDSNPPLLYRQLTWNTPSTTTSSSAGRSATSGSDSFQLSGLPSVSEYGGPFIDSASDACLPPTATSDCAYSYAANGCLAGYTAVRTSTVLLVGATLPQTVRYCCPTEAPSTKLAGSGDSGYVLCNATPDTKFDDVATWRNGSTTETFTVFAGVQYAAPVLVMYEVGAQGLFSNAGSVSAAPSASVSVTADTPTNIGTLSVGGAVAIFVVLGVTLVAGVVLFLWYWRRKRRRLASSEESEPGVGEHTWQKAELHGEPVGLPEADALERVELKGDTTGLRHVTQEMDTERPVGELDSREQPVELPTDTWDQRSARQA